MGTVVAIISLTILGVIFRQWTKQGRDHGALPFNQEINVRRWILMLVGFMVIFFLIGAVYTYYTLPNIGFNWQVWLCLAMSALFAFGFLQYLRTKLILRDDDFQLSGLFLNRVIRYDRIREVHLRDQGNFIVELEGKPRRIVLGPSMMHHSKIYGFFRECAYQNRSKRRRDSGRR